MYSDEKKREKKIQRHMVVHSSSSLLMIPTTEIKIDYYSVVSVLKGSKESKASTSSNRLINQRQLDSEKTWLLVMLLKSKRLLSWSIARDNSVRADTISN